MKWILNINRIEGIFKIRMEPDYDCQITGTIVNTKIVYNKKTTTCQCRCYVMDWITPFVFVNKVPKESLAHLYTHDLP